MCASRVRRSNRGVIIVLRIMLPTPPQSFNLMISKFIYLYVTLFSSPINWNFNYGFFLQEEQEDNGGAVLGGGDYNIIMVIIVVIVLNE